MERVSQLAHQEIVARSIELEVTTCLRSKRFWDPSPDGHQLCEPKIEPIVVVNPLKLLKLRLCTFIKLIKT